jgi:hypothetical protein
MLTTGEQLNVFFDQPVIICEKILKDAGISTLQGIVTLFKP